MEVRKTNGTSEEYSKRKLVNVLKKAYKSAGIEYDKDEGDKTIDSLYIYDGILCSSIRAQLIERLNSINPLIAECYIGAKEKERFVDAKKEFIKRFKASSNTANSTVDDNSNVANKNVSVLNAEIHKEDNIQISRSMIMDKIKEIEPSFKAKNYIKDLESHVIYKNDESSFAGAIAPYCTSITMYPFLTGGIQGIGGLSAAPKNIDSYCGMFCNMIFAISAQFAGAVAASEALLYFTYFAKKEWGEDFYLRSDEFYKIGGKLRALMNETGVWWKNAKELKEYKFTTNVDRYNALRDEIITEMEAPLAEKQLEEYLSQVKENPNYTLKLNDGTRTIKGQIMQYWQQIIYTINQPAAARGYQSAFVNFSYFDKPFFDGMFGDFYFPDGTKPDWESLKWVQMEFMKWFNAERLRTMLTFPVESVTLLEKDGVFVDNEMFQFVCEEYARGHSFFTYISDSVDSLSSCCFSKDTKVLWKSSDDRIRLTSLEELYNLGYDSVKVMHDGTWVDAKAIKLPNRKMYKVVTDTNKEFIMSDNHINITYCDGAFDTEKTTDKLTTNDYLSFTTNKMAFQEEGDEKERAKGLWVMLLLWAKKNVCLSNVVVKDGVLEASLGKVFYDEIKNVVTRGDYEFMSDDEKCILRCADERLFKLYDSIFEQKEVDFNRILKYSCFGTGMACAIIIQLMEPIVVDTTDSAELFEVLGTLLGFVTRSVKVEKDGDTKFSVEFLYSEMVGDGVQLKDNSAYIKIKSIEQVDYKDDIYCIECVDADKPYFTLPSGLITHNCRLKNMIQTKEFNFTNGNIGVQTGSKSVITLNLSRIVQDWYRKETQNVEEVGDKLELFEKSFGKYIIPILERVYIYHKAYNELLWDMYDAKLLPVYSAGFIDLNKQYLTIGLNGLNQAAEFLGLKCNDNERYQRFCQKIFSTVKEQNTLHKVTNGPHKLTFNTEQVPAESLAIKNYNWDKADGYWVPDDTNLYASYVFKPNDKKTNILEKIRLHGRRFIGDYLDGGAAAHLNMDAHLSVNQYKKILLYAAKEGCSYLTFNVPNVVCPSCKWIGKQPVDSCPKCGEKKLDYYDRIIGYLTKISNWSAGRQEENKIRVREGIKDNFNKVETEIDQTNG